MIKIAFLIRSLDYGGAERQLVTLAKAIDKACFDVTVLYFYPGGPLEKDLKDGGIKVISLEKRGRWDLLGFFVRLVYHLKRVRPDVLHGYLDVPNLLTVFLKPLYPSARIVWGVRLSDLDLSHYDWLRRVAFQLECFFARFADLIIVNSNAGRTHRLAHGFPEGKMLVIPNGIDTERFKPDREAGTKVRAEWGITKDQILIGLVARLDPVKDHPTFLRAAALLCDTRDDVRFVCVGAGLDSYAQQLYRLADELRVAEKVVWAGVYADMPAIYNALNVFTSSSMSEGFPNGIGEAMACGVPCVVTDVGDSAWIVGGVGVVVPPRNPEALAAGWMRCLERDTSDIKLTARSRIVENFSVKQLAEQTEKVILATV